MISFNGRKTISLETKKGFGNIVDILNHIMFLQVIYCLMLTIYYNRYQNGKTDFMPVIIYAAFTIIVISIIIFEKYFVELWKVALLEAAAVILVSAAVPIQNEKYWFVFGCLIICARSIYKHRFRVSKTASYSERYRSLNRNKIYIVIIFLLFFIHIFSSDKIEDLSIVSPKVCNYYMLASFAVFTIMLIMIRYAFKFYEYYRRELSEDTSTSKQLKYSFLIILASATIIVSIIFVIFGHIFMPAVNLFKNSIIKIFYSMMLALFNIDLQGEHEDLAAQMEVTPFDGENYNKVNREVWTDSPIASIVPYLLLIIGIAALLYLVWKVYKSILSNYKVDFDEVEFIPGKEVFTEYETVSGKNSKNKFGKTNNERVRKLYFQSIIKKRKKYDVSFNSSNTPKEISMAVVQNSKEKELITQMTDIYEKARYSNQKIEDSEVEEAKKINEQI